MQRLYYVTDNLDDTEAFAKRLGALGISDWNFHVVSRDEAGMIAHHVHRATLYQELDVLHSGERYAMLYAGIGALIAVLLVVADASPVHPAWVFIAGVTAFAAAFGAWTGGLIGVSRENYKLAPFHQDIQAGRHVLMVDVRPAQRNAVRQLVERAFPGMQPRGKDTTFINPFDAPEIVYERIT